ncbi:MAG: ABATE domain-containing protein [Ktedonobacteraceae bacterium]
MQINSQISERAANIVTLSLLGERLCLDFANTIDPRIGDHPHEYLKDYPDLVQWSQHLGIFTEKEGQVLLRKATEEPEEVKITFEQAITLRETIYRIFSSIARKTNPQDADLATLKSAFIEVMAHAQLTTTPEGFVWNWVKLEDQFDGMLWPIVRSAIELLTSEEVRRVKECPGLGDCGWLFLDTSKNGSRQWCSMESCGSRAKMRRQYARKRVERIAHSQNAD